MVDPKSFSPDLFVEIDTEDTGRDHIVIPPNSFALAETVESMKIPRDTLVILRWEIHIRTMRTDRERDPT